MIAVGSWMIGCCLLAQAADESTRPDLRGLRLVPKRTAPAAKFDPERNESGSSGDPGGHPTAPPAGTRRPERTLEDLDPAAHGGRAGMEHVGEGPRKLRPPELLAEAISSPQNGRLKGRPIALVDVLSKTTDRAAQVKAATDYWRLAIAQAQYHFALAGRERLARWAQARHKVSTLAESQLAAAEAAVDDAEFKVLKAGAELGGLVGLEDTERVPWAVDRPHVGAYDSKYDQLFAGKVAPPRLRLIHRTLPISRRAIDVHCEAVVAAQDALDTTEEEYRQGTADYLTVADWFDRLAAERRAFLQSVLRYNEDIVVYAFTVAPADADSTLLTGMLIRRPAPSRRAAGGDESSAGPTDTAPGETEGAPHTFREEESPGADPSMFDSGQRAPQPLQPAADSGPTAAPGRSRLQLSSEARSWRFVLTQAGGRAQQSPQSHGGLYQGLLNAKPAVRAAELAQLLNWDRDLPADAGEKTTLVAALEHAPAGPERRTLIESYWNSRQSIARYQVLGEMNESLGALRQPVLALHSQPGGSGAMMRLQAARQAIQAAVLDEHVRLLTAQFDLTRLAKSPLERAWILPATIPHAGSFDLSLRDPQGRKPPALAGAGSRVLVLHLELENQALAVVFADEYRATVTAAGEHRPASIDVVLSAIDRQFRETQIFLRALSEYNMAIADYALRALPAGVPANRLVEVLAPEHARRPGS
jgi:hypothetical protein